MMDTQVKDPDSPIQKAAGQPYQQFLARVHEQRQPNWYFEIGTATGASLVHATGNAVAVDPKFQILQDNLGSRPRTHLFQMTSDDFFEQGLLRKLTKKVDMAFLDGMHLFEYLLRDFINTEPHCKRGSLVVMHDLVPPTYAAAERKWDRARTKMWTGDVWKVAVILREYRPDLRFRIADCRPSGLGLITRLDPKNTVLKEKYDEIVARFMDMSIDDFGADKLDKLLGMKRANGPIFHDLAGDPLGQPT